MFDILCSSLPTFQSDLALCATCNKHWKGFLISAHSFYRSSTSPLVTIFLFCFQPCIGSVVSTYSFGIPTAGYPEFCDLPSSSVSRYFGKYGSSRAFIHFGTVYESGVAFTIHGRKNLTPVTSAGAWAKPCLHCSVLGMYVLYFVSSKPEILSVCCYKAVEYELHCGTWIDWTFCVSFWKHSISQSCFTVCLIHYT